MLDSNELTAMRDELELALIDPCSIARRTLTADGQGGSTESWAVAGTCLARVSPSATQFAQGARGDRLSSDGEWIVTTPTDTDVRSADRLDILSTTYEVVGVKAPRSWELTRRVICKVIA